MRRQGTGFSTSSMSRDLPPLYILRHGETEWNEEGRFQGQLDSSLTDRGRRQAKAQNAILARIFGDAPFAVRSSPAGRAQATAAIALEGLNVEDDHRVDPRLLEVMMGEWQGYTRDEIAAQWPDAHAVAEDAGNIWQFYAPGGETFDNMIDRCSQVLDEIAQPTVLVTHGVTSRVLRCIALGMDPLDLMELPGGQGIVHHIQDGRAELLK